MLGVVFRLISKRILPASSRTSLYQLGLTGALNLKTARLKL